jgi:hypothetical protein
MRKLIVNILIVDSVVTEHASVRNNADGSDLPLSLVAVEQLSLAVLPLYITCTWRNYDHGYVWK